MTAMPDVDEIAAAVVDTAFKLHRDLGPGLLESAYELILSQKLLSIGYDVDRQMPINIRYDGLNIEHAFRIDLLINKQLIVEIKSTEQTLPVHSKQVITYLRLMNLSVGLIVNFGTATFKDGVRRLVNNHQNFASSRLRANKNIAFTK
jgi:GxxExxY protein